MKKLTRTVLVGVLHSCLLLSFALFAGCSDDDGPTISGTDPEICDSLIAVANDSLGNLLNELINTTLDDPDSSLRPHDLDFTGVKSLYEQAFATCPSSRDARFGAAFTGLMCLLSDTTLNRLYNDFKTMYDTGGFFPSTHTLPVSLNRPLVLEGMPMHPNRFGDILIDITRWDPMMSSMALSDPTVGEVQDWLETSLLPQILTAQAHMTAILAVPSYKFYITPMMQGNPGADSIEVDRTDFRVIMASLYGVEAAIRVAVARDLNLTSFDIDGVEAALSQGSTFLTLRPDGVGETHMSAAKTAILAAESQLELAIADQTIEILSGENQDDDLIKVDLADLEQALDTLVHYRAYFDAPTEIEVSDGDTVTVDISAFFDNPVEDPKDLLPPYVVTVELSPYPWGDWMVCYFWQAQSYAEWNWPYPTVNGLFPEMTALDMKETMLDLLYDGAWEQFDCRTIDFD
ncbi:MAG: hypothetical protein JSU65_02955 [Candidatus Zixiibacteriota bacterium]|nr:MAG: hypothetical protein JSU65_02955 [candidate division Zixibacteria bacterium]